MNRRLTWKEIPIFHRQVILCDLFLKDFLYMNNRIEILVTFDLNRPFSHSKFPCSLRKLGKTKSIRTGASGSKCTRCIWTSECVTTNRYILFLAFFTVNCKKISNQLY